MNESIFVKLVNFSNEHANILNSFELPKEQKQFTSLPTKYNEVEDGQNRIVILHGTEPVGFFLLHSTARVKEYTDNPQAMLLTSLSINHSKQGKGYAKQAMLLLRKFVKAEFPNCNEVVLAVNHRNTAAQQLYLKVGFQNTERRKFGPIGEQFIMNLIV